VQASPHCAHSKKFVFGLWQIACAPIVPQIGSPRWCRTVCTAMNIDRHDPDDASAEDAQLPLLFRTDGDSPSSTTDRQLEGNAGSQHGNARRREFRWSKAARDLVRANMDAAGAEVSALVTRLVEESGNPRWACRRFAQSMGVRSRRPYRVWKEQEQQRLLKLLDLHPVNEISKLMRRSQSSIWHMLQRLGANAKMGKDSFTKYTLAVALHVRPEKVEDWIGRGWLKAREMETGGGRRTVIEAEDFCQFCREHTKDVVGNRLTKERLDFVYHFAFPPSHAHLLPVRESTKERVAYEEQLTEGVESPPPAFGPDRSEDSDDAFERTA
jgi:hypothetical protein